MFLFCPYLFFGGQPAFGYQHQLMPGMRGAAPMPNFFVPMVQQGQQGQRPGGRRGGATPVQQPQQPIPMMQQQVSIVMVPAFTLSLGKRAKNKAFCPNPLLFAFLPGPLF